MATRYTGELIKLLKEVGLPVPRPIRNDQAMTAHLIPQIVEKVKEIKVGNCPPPGDCPTLDEMTVDGTAVASDIALNKVAYAKGQRLVGTLVVNGGQAPGEQVTVAWTVGEELSEGVFMDLLSTPIAHTIRIVNGVNTLGMVPVMIDLPNEALHYMGGYRSSGGSYLAYTMVVSRKPNGKGAITAFRSTAGSGADLLAAWSDRAVTAYITK